MWNRNLDQKAKVLFKILVNKSQLSIVISVKIFFFETQSHPPENRLYQNRPLPALQFVLRWTSHRLSPKVHLPVAEIPKIFGHAIEMVPVPAGKPPERNQKVQLRWIILQKKRMKMYRQKKIKNLFYYFEVYGRKNYLIL